MAYGPVENESEMKLDQCLLRENNNYDVLRLIAAGMVIVGHAHALVPSALSTQDFVATTLHFDYAGSLAVKFFFFLSGLVVTNSLVHKPGLVAFTAARMFRIFPGLIACVLFCALVIGPLFSTLSLTDYLSHPETASYVKKNILLSLQWELPGVFMSNPVHAINGSLWTLPIEIRCYVVLLGLGLAGIISSRTAATVAMALVIYTAIAAPQQLAPLGFTGEAILLPACFAFGALLAIHQDKCEISTRVLLGLCLISYVMRNSSVFQYCVYISAFYGALVVASSSLAKAYKLPGDFSYGVYIYGYPVQQVLVGLQPEWGLYLNQTATLIGAIVLATLSWFLIEKPSIEFGRKWFRRG